MVCQVGTIREIQRRLVQEGHQVSECALRRWIKEEKPPAIHTGNKALISYNKVLEILMETPSAAFTAVIN